MYVVPVLSESPGSQAKATQTCCLIHARLIKQDRFIIKRKIGTPLLKFRIDGKFHEVIFIDIELK